MNLSNSTQTLPNTDKIRIAVCFSGQARFWKECVDNIKFFFGSTHNPEFNNIPIVVDFFIHTWDTNTWRYPKTDHSIFHNVKHDDGSSIAAAYEPKGFQVEQWEQPLFPRAWDSMFYSFAKSLMLKRNYELQHNFQYDVVVKARLDVVYNPRLRFPLQRITPKTCYTCNIDKFPLEFNYNNFDDVIFYGDSPTMDLVGDLYHSYKQAHSSDQLDENTAKLNLDPTSCYGPGCLLYDHMISMGIHPEKRPNIDYAVMRSTAAAHRLDALTDYDIVKQTWIDWYHA